MVWRQSFESGRWQRDYQKSKKEMENLSPTEYIARRKKRHSDTVTRYYYRNRDKVNKQKRVAYLKKKGLSKDEIIDQLLMERSNIKNPIYKNIV